MSNKTRKGPKPIGNSHQAGHFERSEKSPQGEQIGPAKQEPGAQPKEISRSARNDGEGRTALLTIIHGGRAAEAMRDMLTVVRRALEGMKAGESALIINTSASHKAMDEVTMKIARRQPAKLHTFSASGDALLSRLGFLEHIIQTKGVRLIAISSFEFAAWHSRGRTKIVHWLRRMRDEHEVSIVIYTMETHRPRPEAPHMGALALLAWTSDAVRSIAEEYDQQKIFGSQTANTTLAEVSVEADFSLPPHSNEECPLDPIQNSELKTQNSPNTPSFREEREISSGSAGSALQHQTQDHSLREALALYEARQNAVLSQAEAILADDPLAETPPLIINDLQSLEA
jgi:hypothetical protein